MKRWALIQNNLVATVTEQETQPTIIGLWVECVGEYSGPGCKYIDGEFLPPDPTPTILSKLQMLELLGSDYNVIINTAKTDIDVQVWLEKFRLSDSFNLSDINIINQINFLVSKDLITQEKLNLILTAKNI